MTDDLSRRGFLKGLMAAAAVPVIAPSILEEWAEQVLGAPVIDTSPLAISVDFGDLWARVHGGVDTWRFIGKLTSTLHENDPIETTHLGDGYRQFIKNPISRLTIEMANEPEGEMILREMCYSPKPIDLLLGVGKEHEMEIPLVYVQGHQLEMQGRVLRSTITAQYGDAILRGRA